MQEQIMRELLARNENPPGYKEVITRLLKVREDRAYWYFTVDEAQFLCNVYERQLDKDILRKRIAQITEEKLREVVDEICQGKIDKLHSQKIEVDLIERMGIKELAQSLEDGSGNVERVRKIRQQFVEYKQKSEQMKQRHRQKMAEREAVQEQIRRGIEKEKKQEYRSEIEKKIEQIKRKQQERKTENEKYKLFLKEFKKHKPLFVRMEESYHDKKQSPPPETVTKLKKLSFQEILQHQKAYLARKSEKGEKTFAVHRNVEVSYKSPFYQQEEEKQEQPNATLQNVQKRRQYSLIVKDKFKPKKMRTIEEPSKTQRVIERQSLDRSKVIQIGNEYMSFMRALEKHRSITPVIQTAKQPRYMNYLEELKVQNEDTNKLFSWEKDMKDRSFSTTQKREKVLLRSRQLEEKARRDEELIHHFTYGNAESLIERKKDIDEILLSAMKAKVAVLRDAKNTDIL